VRISTEKRGGQDKKRREKNLIMYFSDVTLLSSHHVKPGGSDSDSFSHEMNSVCCIAAGGFAKSCLQ
jgi:hypothetical protein